MITKDMNTNCESSKPTEKFTIQLTDSLLYDRLHTLSTEYSISVEFLANVAVRRLIKVEGYFPKKG